MKSGCMQPSFCAVAKAIEEHGLDADVVMEVLDVTQRARGTAEMHVDSGAAMRGKREGMRVGDGGRIHETGNTAAAGGIGLDDIDGFGVDHFAQVHGDQPYSPAAMSIAGRSAVAEQSGGQQGRRRRQALRTT